MRRRLFDIYHSHIARYASYLPDGVRAAIAGMMYRMTRHPDFGFVHARSLVARGHSQRAAQLYAEADGRVEDPLFTARLEPTDKSAAKYASGLFRVQIGFHGLRLSGEVCDDSKNRKTQRLALEVNGEALRTETLRFRNGRAEFRCRISRPTLEHFPKECCLTARLEDGRHLPAPHGGDGWRLTLPHGRGDIGQELSRRGPIEKKGNLRPDAAELQERQSGYLALYRELREVFEHEFNRPLLILYGTLLGQVRSGDFIPGDDDFDVGYPTTETTPEAVRAEAIAIMTTLANRGFVMVLNENGRPFRVRAGNGPTWRHLDNRPIYCPGDGHVWLHKHARLRLPMKDFEIGEEALLQGQPVLRPQHPEAFLRAYYGEGWKVPDPGYSNATQTIPEKVTKGLSRICLTPAEQRDLAARFPGQIVPERWQSLYPLETYASRIGF